MAHVGSPERPTTFSMGGGISGAVMSPPPEAHVQVPTQPVKAVAPATLSEERKRLQAIFDRENAGFHTHPDSLFLRPFFSDDIYATVESFRHHCCAHRKHENSLYRMAGYLDTHLAVRVLNRYLLDPAKPLESRVDSIYKEILRLHNPSVGTSGEIQEMRERVANVFLAFYNKQVGILANYLVHTKQRPTIPTAVGALVVNQPSGNFVDSLACQMVLEKTVMAKNCQWVPL